MFSYLEASRALKIPIHFPDPANPAKGVSIDTRTIVPGDLFVALKGEHQDGHQYIEEAFRKGASGALIEQQIFDNKTARFFARRQLFQNLLPVSNPEKALGELAAWHRSRHLIQAIGITGSVGKTTTKEFLSYLLRKKYSVLANQGNFNNSLGLPLTLLRIEEGNHFCVAELGASHGGEIRELADLLKPTAGVITQVSPAHLEGFGSLDAIYEAKLELFEVLSPNSAAVLPDRDPELIRRAKRYDLNFILVGESEDADYRISDVCLRDSLVHFEINQKWHFAFPGIASFMAQNAAMAIAAAVTLGLLPQEIPEIWEDLALPAGRFEEKRIGNGVRVIDDGYNANPASFEKALEAFRDLKVSGRRILIFADMLELGKEEERYHAELGRKIADRHFDLVIAFGDRAKTSIEALCEVNGSASVHYFKTCAEAAVFLSQEIQSGDMILTKASRGMKIEEVLRLVQEKTSSAF